MKQDKIMNKELPVAIKCENYEIKESTNEWLLDILKDMVKNKFYMVDYDKLKIYRNKDTTEQFSFEILIDKSLFEDILRGEDNEQ